MKLALAFILGMVAMVCIQGRSQSEHDRSKTWLVFSGLAHHFDGNGYCNNRFTKGIGLEHKGYAIGVYDNSNCDTSFYAAKAWRPLQSGSWRGGAIAGVVSGYGSPALPIAGLVVTYERKTWGLTATLIPPVGPSSGVAWIQIKRAFEW